MQQKTQAQSLYFQSDLTQVQIADILGISSKTIYRWIKDGNWTRTRNVDNMTQMRLIQQYYTQLENLNMELMGPKRCYSLDHYYDNMRKIATIIKTITPKQTKNQYSAVIYEFITQFQKENPELSNQVKPYIINFITSKDHNFPIEDYFTPTPGENPGSEEPENPAQDEVPEFRDSYATENELISEQVCTPENETTDISERPYLAMPENPVPDPSAHELAEMVYASQIEKWEKIKQDLFPSEDPGPHLADRTFRTSDDENNINEINAKTATEAVFALRSPDPALPCPVRSEKNIAPALRTPLSPWLPAGK